MPRPHDAANKESSMKRLACLCALFFAGHVMAQATCSDATFKGTYLGINPSGELAAGVHLYAEALATVNGDGTGTLSLNYTTTGGVVNGSQIESITYNVNPDCSLTATAAIAGITVAIKGHILPSGDKGVVVSQTPGISANAEFFRQ
jgi:hypothetical protein